MNVFLQKALCKRQRPDLLSCGSLSLLIPPPHAPSSVKLMSDRTSCLKPFNVSLKPTDSEWAPVMGSAHYLLSRLKFPHYTCYSSKLPNYFLSPLSTLLFNMCYFSFSDLSMGHGEPFRSTIYGVFDLVQVKLPWAFTSPFVKWEHESHIWGCRGHTAECFRARPGEVAQWEH